MAGFIKNVLYVLFSILILETQAAAHGLSLPVIVDTDMALDDIRAVTMLLNSNAIQTPLIIVSDGVRSPEEGVENLKTILKYFNRNNIEVVRGKDLEKPPPEVRKFIDTIKVPGGGVTPEKNIIKISAPEKIISTINLNDDHVIYLCMGPLTNLADAIQIDPGIKDRISFLIYLGHTLIMIIPDGIR